jgi:branched-chain amino acid transport system ATP-binding protein
LRRRSSRHSSRPSGFSRKNLAILLIEQNLGVATALAERQLVMIGGRIAAETTATKLSSDPDLQRQYLGVEPLAH